MGQIIVRPETRDDIKAIDVVNLSAFEGENEATFVTAMRSDPGFDTRCSLVAEFNGRIVGHVLLTKVTLRQADGDTDVMVLGPMSVVPSQSHRGIGSELVEAAVKQCSELDTSAIIVVGHPEYYKRFGFDSATRWGIHFSLPISDDVVTAKEIRAKALEAGGQVIFNPKFSEIYYQVASDMAS